MQFVSVSGRGISAHHFLINSFRCPLLTLIYNFITEAFKKALVCQIRAAFSPTYFQWHEKKTRDQFRSLAQHITDDDQAFCASFFGDVVVAEHHKCIQPLAEISCGIYNLICYYALAFSWLFLSFL